MNTITLTERRKSQQIIKKYPLSASDRMAVWNCRVHSALYVGQCQRSWKDLKIFTFTSYGTPTPATCSQTGQPPKDVQELLGHSDVSTTMNIYAHSTRKAKRDSARLLDKVASNA